jgi:hypothetical protein
MHTKPLSIRPLIGARDFEVSKSFYRVLGFEERMLSPGFCLFKADEIAFYLQDAYVKDWIENTMIFVEVEDVDRYWKELESLNLPSKFENVRLTATRVYDWGKECFLHDPSGILWHFGQFANK